MKHRHIKLPKANVFKLLAERGITAKRTTNPEGLRVWETSDGHWFESINHIVIAYKLGKVKA